MSEPGTASGPQSTPSSTSAGTSLGLPSADEIQKSIERLKEQMNHADQAPGGQEAPDESTAADGSHGSAEPAAEPRPAEEPAAPAAAADAAATAGEAGSSEATDEGGDDGERRRTLKETADGLKTSAKSLYEMEVPLNDGSGRYMSVEDLKAGYLAGEAGTLDAERHEFARDKALHEQQRIEHENKILKSTRELQEVMALVVDAIPHQQLAQYQKAATDRAAMEAGKLVEVMPQFRDQTVYAGWMKDATGLLGDYGFTAAEANNIGDHRIYKMLDDFMRLKGRVRALETIPDEIKTPPRGSTRRAGPRKSSVAQAVERARETGNKDDQVTAARLLIEQGGRR